MKKEKVFDELLVLQFQAGSKQALELLFRRWNKKLVQRAYWQTRNIPAAQDVVQEVWIIVWRDLMKLKDASKFSSWILTITYRKAVDWVRMNQKERKANEALPASEETDHDHDENQEDNINVLQKALTALDVDQRNILSLYYLDKQSVAAIASILKIPKGTVKSRLYHAREKLKNIIESQIKFSRHENE